MFGDFVEIVTLSSFSWFIIMFCKSVDCNSVEIVAAFLFICIHVGIRIDKVYREFFGRMEKLNKNSKGLEVLMDRKYLVFRRICSDQSLK